MCLTNGAKETRTPDPLHAMKGNAPLRCVAGEGISLIAHSWLYQIYTPRFGQRYQALRAEQPISGCGFWIVRLVPQASPTASYSD